MLARTLLIKQMIKLLVHQPRLCMLDDPITLIQNLKLLAEFDENGGLMSLSCGHFSSHHWLQMYAKVCCKDKDVCQRSISFRRFIGSTLIYSVNEKQK